MKFTVERFTARESDRHSALRRIADRHLLAAAFDGPLRSDLTVIGRYRAAEKHLTAGLQPWIGKPGQSSSPNGKLLNHHANLCAEIILSLGVIATAGHDHAIHAKSIAEAFPTSFLGVLIESPEKLDRGRKKRSDAYYVELVRTGGLQLLVESLLPGRAIERLLGLFTNHDDRAAVVCAISALCVAAGDYTVVGDAQDGWIVLPSKSFIQTWAWNILNANTRGGGCEWRQPAQAAAPD